MISLPKFFLGLCGSLILALGAGVLQAAPTTAQPSAETHTQVEDPIVLLERVTGEIFAALKRHDAEIKHNPGKVFEVVDNYIMPYVDFEEMARWITGRKAWAKASEADRKDFIAAFQELVVSTYGTALNNYSDESVEFMPTTMAQRSRVQIGSWIRRQGKDDIRVDFRLVRHQQSWRLYDVVIEGISILQGFQAQFSDKVRHAGLRSVIADIKEHNEDQDT